MTECSWCHNLFHKIIWTLVGIDNNTLRTYQFCSAYCLEKFVDVEVRE